MFPHGCVADRRYLGWAAPPRDRRRSVGSALNDDREITV
jgi:hypothetical protein